MNLGEHLTALFNKAGVPVEDSALKDLVTKVATVDISDDLVNRFNQTFMTIDAAKANPKLIGHFKAQHYNGLDDEIKPLYEELEIPEDVKTELFSETSSTKRVTKLLRKVKELTEKKAGANKGEKAELANQIADLNKQIKTEKENAVKAVADKEKEFNDKLKNVYLTQKLAGHKYASDLAAQKNYLLPKTLLEDELKSKGLRVTIENEDLKLETEQGTPYFENNNQVDFKAFTEKVLAHHKLTAVSNTGNIGEEKKIEINSGLAPGKLKGVAAFDEMIREAETN